MTIVKNNIRMTNVLTLAAVAMATFALTTTSVNGAIITQTDFTGRTVAGLTANTITWTTDGVQDPGSLTAINEAPGTMTMLFDTVNAQGHFAPAKNVGNNGPWSVDVPLVLDSGTIVTLDSVDLDWQHFNNSGVFQGPSRSVDWTVEVTGSSSGVLDTVSALNVSGTSGLQTLTFAPSLNLTTAETYTLNIFATGSNATGNNTGLDGLTLNGTAEQVVAIPEPSAFALSLLSLGFVGWRRKRR